MQTLGIARVLVAVIFAGTFVLSSPELNVSISPTGGFVPIQSLYSPGIAPNIVEAFQVNGTEYIVIPNTCPSGSCFPPQIFSWQSGGFSFSQNLTGCEFPGSVSAVILNDSVVLLATCGLLLESTVVFSWNGSAYTVSQTIDMAGAALWKWTSATYNGTTYAAISVLGEIGSIVSVYQWSEESASFLWFQEFAQNDFIPPAMLYATDNELLLAFSASDTEMAVWSMYANDTFFNIKCLVDIKGTFSDLEFFAMGDTIYLAITLNNAPLQQIYSYTNSSFSLVQALSAFTGHDQFVPPHFANQMCSIMSS
jgi:hypothetical protein